MPEHATNCVVVFTYLFCVNGTAKKVVFCCYTVRSMQGQNKDVHSMQAYKSNTRYSRRREGVIRFCFNKIKSGNGNAIDLNEIIPLCSGVVQLRNKRRYTGTSHRSAQRRRTPYTSGRDF